MELNHHINCINIILHHKNLIFNPTLLLSYGFDNKLHWEQLPELSISESQHLKKLSIKSSKYFEFINSRNLIKDILTNKYNLQDPSIEKGVFNFPIIKSSNNNHNLDLTISSSNNLWGALIFDSKCPLGIDIENLSSNKSNNIKSFLKIDKPSDVTFTDSIFYTMLWCSIESLSKALKIGIYGNLNVFKPSQIKIQEGLLVINYKYFPQFACVCIPLDNHILAISYPSNCLIEFN